MNPNAPSVASKQRAKSGGHPHGRHYVEIVKHLEAADLDPPVRERALAIGEALGIYRDYPVSKG